MPTIETSSDQFYVHPKAEVSFSPTLGGTWTKVSYLRCRQIRICCSPEIGQATLRYDYGLIMQEDASSVSQYLPIDIAGKFVRIVITDTVKTGTPPAPANSITWYGIVQPDIRTPDGSNSAGQPSGHQDIVAFGLERLLEMTEVKTSVIDTDGTEAGLFEVQRGLTFNNDETGEFGRRGNMSDSRIPSDSSFVFSWEAREKNNWNAHRAVQYLLAHHSPLTSTGSVANKWRIDGSSEIIDWYEIGLATEGRTLKELIDALIPRSRGVSYWVDFDTTDSGSGPINECVIKPFTFVSNSVVLPNGATIPANPDVVILDFEESIDVEAEITNTTVSQYHRVTVRGARRTTTFTSRIDNLDEWAWAPETILGPAWSLELEEEYKAGASGAADYGSLDTIQQQFRNSVARRSERLTAVYSQFVLNAERGATAWDCKIPFPHIGLSVREFWLVPDISPVTVDPKVPDPATGGRDWIPGLRIRPSLPFYEGYDYSGTRLADFSFGTAFSASRQPSFIRPLIYGRTSGTDDASYRYEALDRTHRPSLVPVNERERNWSLSVTVHGTSPGMELNCRVPHFLAGTTAGAGDGWATTADDELAEQHGGIPYSDLWATICVELNSYVEATVALSAPASGSAPENVLMIAAPDCRADYVLPYTTVEIKDGKPVATTSGGWARDDRARLKSIARGAAEWYGKKRQTIRMSFMQVRSLVKLGQLITSIGTNYSLTGINTPVTAVTYDLGDDSTPGKTTFETGFANLDFVQ